MPQGPVLVVEDDPTNRLMITQILKRHGLDVVSAANGQLGLELARECKPSVVVTDIQMPVLNGMQLLGAIRQDLGLSTTPVLMLTSLSERAQVRSGMNAGADDYLTKPFTPQELVEAVQAQLAKRGVKGKAQDAAVQEAVDTALELQRHSLAGLYEKRLKRELSEQVWQLPDKPQQDRSFEQATLLFADLISPDWAKQLDPADLADVLKVAYVGATDTLGLFGAQTVHMVGEGLLVVFTPEKDSVSVNHATKALRSAMAMAKAAQRVEQHLQKRFPDRHFSRFDIGAALHTGPVAIARITDPERPDHPFGLPVGESVKLVMRLQQKATDAKCSLVASETTIALLPKNLMAGRQAEVRVGNSGQTIRVAEILGLRDAKFAGQG